MLKCTANIGYNTLSIKQLGHVDTLSHKTYGCEFKMAIMLYAPELKPYLSPG